MMTNALMIEFQQFMLMFIRLITVISLLPFFGAQVIPRTVKIGIAVVLAYLLVPTLSIDPLSLPTTLLDYAYVVLQEVMVGLIMGFTASFLFIGVQATGQILGIQMGLSISQVIDPQSQEQVAIVGQLEYTLAMLAFLAWNGHLFFISLLRQSFDLVPPASFLLNQMPVEHMVVLLRDMIILGVKIASPVIVVLLMSTILFALVARVVPRMNVFILTFPVSIGVGLLTIGLTLDMSARVFRNAYISLQDTLWTMLTGMAP